MRSIRNSPGAVVLKDHMKDPAVNPPKSLSDILKRMRKSTPELVWSYDRLAQFGQHCDYFFAFTVWNDALYSLNTRDLTLSLDGIGQPGFHDDQIILTRYEKTGAGYEIAEQRDLGFGGDPRVVSDGQRAFALILGTHFSFSRVYLYDFSTDRRLPILVEDPDFEFGKNWQPFLKNGELFVVHQLSPIRILKVDTDTGLATQIAERDLDFKLTASYQPFPLFRGGANAIALGDDIVGLGRTTANRVHHTPFFWSLDDDLHIDILFTELFQIFVELGYGIIDPTSFFIHNDDLYVGLACSERNWAHTQILSDYLLVFPAEDRAPQYPLWSDYLDKRQMVTKNGKPDLRRHLFHCSEMPQTRDFTQRNGGVISDGQAGHMLYGPYAEIEEPGQYAVEFSYLAHSDHEGQIGLFEALIFDGEMLGDSPITACPGKIGTARIEFDISDPANKRLETRVGVNKGVVISAYHIRIWRRDLAAGGDPNHPWADIYWA